MTYSRFLENRPEDATRYDDRKTLRKNIIQSYREMMEFIDRYLPDKFYLPSNGDTARQDLRVQLFREIVGNICAHTDYSRQCASFLEVFYDRVITKNATMVVPEIGEGQNVPHDVVDNDAENAGTLAMKFSVTPRTIQRDLDQIMVVIGRSSNSCRFCSSQLTTSLLFVVVRLLIILFIINSRIYRQINDLIKVDLSDLT